MKKPKPTQKTFLITALIATLIAVGAIAYAQTGQGHPLSEVDFTTGSANGNLNMNGNNLTYTGGLMDKVGTSCEANEYINGIGYCTDDTSAATECSGSGTYLAGSGSCFEVPECVDCDSRFVNEGDDQIGSLTCERSIGTDQCASCQSVDANASCSSGYTLVGGACEVFPDLGNTGARVNPSVYGGEINGYDPSSKYYWCHLETQEDKKLKAIAFAICCKVV